MRSDREAQLQLLESVMVALFIFIAIAVVAVYRLPSAPQTFQTAELGNVAADALKVRQARVPTSGDDCNESPCPFANDLERLLSLALGYVGATVSGAGEDPSVSELRSFLDQALPPGANYRLTIGNGHNQTVVTPLNVVPPAVSVVVARTIISPNWTVHGPQLGQSVWLRVGDRTGFGAGVTEIYDPLNRVQDQWAFLWRRHLAEGYASTVPLNATYGTFKVCYGADCRFATIVPDGVGGPGVKVRAGDLKREAPIRDFNPTADPDDTTLARLLYQGTAGWTGQTPAYLHRGLAPQVALGDVRLSRVPAPCRTLVLACEPGTLVRAIDQDVVVPTDLDPVTTRVRATNATLGTETDVYVFQDNGRTTAADGDIRLTRIGPYAQGSRVAAGDVDIGAAVLGEVDLDKARVQYADLDGNTAYDEGEPLFLNLDGLGAASTPDVDVNDSYIAPLGRASQRYAYDVKLEVWYGA